WCRWCATLADVRTMRVVCRRHCTITFSVRLRTTHARQFMCVSCAVATDIMSSKLRLRHSALRCVTPLSLPTASSAQRDPSTWKLLTGRQPSSATSAHMLTNRVIVCLDVRGGRVVKGVQFVGLRDVGDPVVLAERYEREGADEIAFLDISASVEERATLLDAARRTAERLFIPLTIGGGVRTVSDVARVLRAGADKVSLNSAAVARPELLTEAAQRFGAQCVVASIDAKRDGDR